MLGRASKAAPIANLLELGFAIEVVPVPVVIILVHAIGTGTLIARPSRSHRWRTSVNAPSSGLLGRWSGSKRSVPGHGSAQGRWRVALERNRSHHRKRSHSLFEAVAPRAWLSVGGSEHGPRSSLLVRRRRRFELILLARGATVAVSLRSSRSTFGDLVLEVRIAGSRTASSRAGLW